MIRRLVGLTTASKASQTPAPPGSAKCRPAAARPDDASPASAAVPCLRVAGAPPIPSLSFGLPLMSFRTRCARFRLVRTVSPGGCWSR